MKEVVIASACRTAIGTFGGTLKDSHAAIIAAATMKSAIERAGIDPALIDDVRYGCCMEPPDSLNVARVAALLIPGWAPNCPIPSLIYQAIVLLPPERTSKSPSPSRSAA